MGGWPVAVLAAFRGGTEAATQSVAWISENLSTQFDGVEKTVMWTNDLSPDSPGTATGFTALDAMTAGLQAGDLTILGARPSMGKTSFALNVAGNVAGRGGKRVAVFSLEMPSNQAVSRMLASEARVNLKDARSGTLTDGDIVRLAATAERMSTWRLFIDNTPGLAVMDALARCRQLATVEPLALVVIDYLQLLRGPGDAKTREQEVSDIVRGLKEMAQELEAPVLVLSQLSRALESRENKRPVTGDLRESPAVAENADTILFLYRDEVYDEDSKMKGIAEVIVAKQPNGRIGSCECVFREPWARFEDLPGE